MGTIYARRSRVYFSLHGVCSVNVGDLVFAKECKETRCNCFLCMNNSNRIGIIIEAWAGEDDEMCYFVEFDIGEWPVYTNGATNLHLELLSEMQ